MKSFKKLARFIVNKNLKAFHETVPCCEEGPARFKPVVRSRSKWANHQTKWLLLPAGKKTWGFEFSFWPLWSKWAYH